MNLMYNRYYGIGMVLMGITIVIGGILIISSLVMGITRFRRLRHISKQLPDERSLRTLFAWSLLEPTISLLYRYSPILIIMYDFLYKITLFNSTHLFFVLYIPLFVIHCYPWLKLKQEPYFLYQKQLRALAWLGMARIGITIITFWLFTWFGERFGIFAASFLLIIQVLEPLILLFISRAYIKRWEQQLILLRSKALSVGTGGMMVVKK